MLRLALHAASVRALALSSAAGLLALGDEAGRLSLVDLRQARPLPACLGHAMPSCAHAMRDARLLPRAQAAVRLTRQLADQPIVALAFAAVAAPSRGLAERLSERRCEGEGERKRERSARLALYVAAADCSLAVADARSGEPLGRDAWLRPKAADSALALLPLDGAGEPLPPPSAPLPLAWARVSVGVPGTPDGAHAWSAMPARRIAGAQRLAV